MILTIGVELQSFCDVFNSNAKFEVNVSSKLGEGICRHFYRVETDRCKDAALEVSGFVCMNHFMIQDPALSI